MGIYVNDVIDVCNKWWFKMNNWIVWEMNSNVILSKICIKYLRFN